ncbi:MAG TPA: hypothetical protein VMW78_01870 [Anaerolineae bacterium]|nr:hypothetical protein [Anaerolineae bacterium]
MRKAHIIGGQIVFGLGLFLLYLNSTFVVEFIKGAIQPIIILLGLLCLAVGVLGKTGFKKINLAAAAIFLILGLYGLYDEYYAVADFFNGFFPVLLIIAGVISIVHGIKKLN